jgi:hypothetical protein
MNTKQQNDLQYIEGLVKLMKDYQLDVIDLGSIKLVKSHHTFTNQPNQPVEDDNIFYSSDDS